MSRHHGLSDREPTLPFGIASDWTPEQAFAVVEMLDELRELIYAHYLQQIQDHLRAEFRANGARNHRRAHRDDGTNPTRHAASVAPIPATGAMPFRRNAPAGIFSVL